MSSTITYGAGSLDQDTKRHSRSLDLDSTARTVRHLHQRSASDGLDISIATSNNNIEPIPTIPMSNSVFSLYKKLGSPGRNRSLNDNKRSQFSKSRASIGSAFSSFRQPSASSLKKSSNPRFSCVSSPVNNPGKIFTKAREKKTILTFFL